MTEQQSRVKTEEEMADLNRELNFKIEIDSVSVGDKFWDSIQAQIWVVTKITVKFTDKYSGTPVVDIELHNQKKGVQHYTFPSAHNVYGFSMYKPLQ